MFGTRSLRVDLVDPDIKFKPTISPWALPLITFPTTQKDSSFARVKVVGPLVEFQYLSRNNEVGITFFPLCSPVLSDMPKQGDSENRFDHFSFDSPVFANGTAIPNGSYRMLLRVLRVTGNPKDEEDYESWLSPIIGIKQ